MNSLKGKNALITGASSGIGSEYAIILAELGVNINIVARRADRLAELKSRIIEKYQVKVNIIVADLSMRESPAYIFDQLRQQGIHIDILINNAGFGVHEYFNNTPWKKNLEMIDLLVVNLVHLVQLFIPAMIENKYGYILNTCSTASFQPVPTYAIYASSKSFVFNFTIALNFELKKHNVKCLAICPGATQTEFFEVANHGPKSLFVKFTLMTAHQVARIGVKSMFKNKLYTVAGLFNKINSLFASLLPKGLSTMIAAAAMGKPVK